jgi:hypothetical protein
VAGVCGRSFGEREGTQDEGGGQGQEPPARG